MNECIKIKSVGKRKRTQENYSGSSSNLRVLPLPSHPVKDFHYVWIFVTSNLNPRPPNNISIHQDSTPLSFTTIPTNK